METASALQVMGLKIKEVTKENDKETEDSSAEELKEKKEETKESQEEENKIFVEQAKFRTRRKNKKKSKEELSILDMSEEDVSDSKVPNVENIKEMYKEKNILKEIPKKLRNPEQVNQLKNLQHKLWKLKKVSGNKLYPSKNDIRTIDQMSPVSVEIKERKKQLHVLYQLPRQFRTAEHSKKMKLLTEEIRKLRTKDVIRENEKFSAEISDKPSLEEEIEIVEDALQCEGEEVEQQKSEIVSKDKQIEEITKTYSPEFLKKVFTKFQGRKMKSEENKTRIKAEKQIDCAECEYKTTHIENMERHINGFHKVNF